MAMRNLVLAILVALIALVACSASGSSGTDQHASTPGESLFKSQCVMCHGRKGNLNMSGAKDLTTSTLTEEEMIAVVSHGRGGMIGYNMTLSQEQIKEVVAHVRTLHVDEVDG